MIVDVLWRDQSQVTGPLGQPQWPPTPPRFYYFDWSREPRWLIDDAEIMPRGPPLHHLGALISAGKPAAPSEIAFYEFANFSAKYTYIHYHIFLERGRRERGERVGGRTRNCSLAKLIFSHTLYLSRMKNISIHRRMYFYVDDGRRNIYVRATPHMYKHKYTRAYMIILSWIYIIWKLAYTVLYTINNFSLKLFSNSISIIKLSIYITSSNRKRYF